MLVLPHYYIAFDLETNGFLEETTKIHCAVTVDVQTGEMRDYGPDQIDQFIEDYEAHLAAGHIMVAHNGIKFDFEVIKKLYGIETPKEQAIDTIVLARVIMADIKNDDFTRNRRWKKYKEATEKGEPWTKPVPLEFPGNLIGLHSLKAWGYRLGEHKGDYSGGWDKWSPEMHDYMKQDGVVLVKLLKVLLSPKRLPEGVELSWQCIWLEHRIAWLCAQIERNGFPFDIKAATELYGRLVDEREALRRELIDLFPNWHVRLPDFIPKRDNKPKGYVKGVPVERWKEIEFNPQSRAHIINRLQHKYGWKPSPDEYTQQAETDPVTGEKIPKGSPKMDEEVLSRLPYPEAPRLARLFLLNKRIGQLAEGNQAWLKVQKNGKIHASYNTNGAVTGRATHSRPNISQVPRVSSEFGRDCRALFHVPEGWVLIGADQSGLELRCLASDMSPYDKGEYAKVVVEGDVHTLNQQAAELPTRDNAKTFIYAFLYGAGDEKIGQIVGKGRAIGRKLKQAFLAKTPALKKLISFVKSKASERGWIKGIDGRVMPIRSSHAALNTRLQNSGAVICKQWGCDADDLMKERGLKHGWDGDYAFLSWSHDEYQVACRNDPEKIATVRECLQATGRAAGKPFNFRCPLDVDTKVGTNWAETH